MAEGQCSTRLDRHTRSTVDRHAEWEGTDRSKLIARYTREGLERDGWRRMPDGQWVRPR